MGKLLEITNIIHLFDKNFANTQLICGQLTDRIFIIIITIVIILVAQNVQGAVGGYDRFTQ